MSYWNIAQLLIKEQYPEQADELQSRMVTEEYAKDSHENVLFSLCRFSEMTAKYPTMVTVIGFEFKRKRFQDIHRLALRYPEDK